MGLAVFASAFVLFVLGAAPGLYLRDAGELATAAFTLGVAHETGFPLWCLLAKAATLLPLGEVATRVNLLSAGAGAAAAFGVYRLVAALAGGDRSACIAGVGAALSLACGLTFFRAATVAEVYTPTAAVLVLGLGWAVRAVRGDRSAGLALALLGGLSLGLHTQARLLLGPTGIALGLYRLRRGDRWPLLGPIAVAVGAVVIAYLPLRAARGPAANWGEPRTLGAVIDHLQARRIRRAFAEEMFSPEPAVIRAHAAGFGRLIEGQLGLPVLLLATAGLVALARRDRAALAALAVVLFGDVAYSIWVNPMALEDLQDGVPTAVAVATLGGVGAAAAGRRLGRGAPWAVGALSLCAAAPAALADLDAKWGLQGEASTWTRAALAAAPNRALVLTTSDDLSAGVLYEQVVAGERPDLTVLVRQQLWDARMVEARVRRADRQVRALDGWRKRGEGAWTAGEQELLSTLLRREGARRTVLWEPGVDLPPIGALRPGVPLFRWAPAALPLEPAEEQASRVEALLRPARDPFVRRLGAVTLGGLGRAYFGRGDQVRAAALFETALVLWPGDPAAAVDLAVVAARRGDFRGALARLEAVLERHPNRVVARVNAGRYRLVLGDADGAEREFAHARLLAPRDPTPLLGLARVARQRGRAEESRRMIDAALRIRPADPEARALREELKR